MKIGGIEAKFHAEFDFEVQKNLAPRKLGKKRKKLFPEETNQSKRVFFSLRESGRRFFRAGSRRGDIFAREVGAAIFSRGKSARFSRGGPSCTAYRWLPGGVVPLRLG